MKVQMQFKGKSFRQPISLLQIQSVEQLQAGIIPQQQTNDLLLALRGMTAPLGIGKHALLPLNLRAKDCCWLDASYSWRARERRNGIAQSASEHREGQLALPTAHNAAAEHLQAQHRQRTSYRQKLHMLTI